MLLTLALLLYSNLFTQVVISQDTNLTEVSQAFINADIPEDIYLKFDPSFLLEVSLPQATNSSIVLKAGVELPRNATVGPPSFTLVGQNINRGPFVVAAVDPDAVQSRSEIRHFLGGNFVAEHISDTCTVLSNKTAAVSEWLQPSPPVGTGIHRYIFLVFKQPKGFNDQTLVNSTSPYWSWNISAFGEAVGLGDPIAGTFFLVESDPVVL
ncbi:PEBP-like protein [Desarmillaria tabescens]|uniref:PEBP-like protein n=1 Tax=Armillaria tabescens TaxID=1929756 RepID=A0AA39NFP0_ARMTA|nr:PEBP-like protein [Desarmillaria tabescens]KAK0464776.1 PEBP-like protein [Desarmillaria tabescens]